MTEQCVQSALDDEKRLKGSLTGNCDTGEFSGFFGGHYRFQGRNPKAGYFADNKYLIMNLADGEIADGSEISGYPTNLGIYRALCPAHAPVDIDATIVSMKGRDTAKAIIKVRHTREDAIHSCQASGTIAVQRVSEDCIRQELAKRVSDVATADCQRGEFTDYYGDRFRVSLNTSQAYPASLFKTNITNLATGKQFDRVHGRFQGAPTDAVLPRTVPGPRAARRIAEVTKCRRGVRRCCATAHCAPHRSHRRC